MTFPNPNHVSYIFWIGFSFQTVANEPFFVFQHLTIVLP